jgi:hypothetical protein
LLREAQADLTGVGRAAEPEMLRRRLCGEMASREAARTSAGRDLWVLRRRLYIVGTAVKKVIFSLVVWWGDEVLPLPLVALGEEEDEGGGRKGAAKRCQTASALKGNMNSMEEPAMRGVRMALTTPWMWCRGRRCRRWSAGEYSQASWRERAWAVRTDWGSRTPFWRWT